MFALADQSWGIVLARWGSALLFAGLVGLALRARLPSRSLFEFKVSLVATELGHWVALVVVVAAILAISVWESLWMRAGFVILATLLLVGFLEAGWKASRVPGARFSWMRAFGLGTSGSTSEVEVERFSYGAMDELELVVCRPSASRKAGARLPWVLSIHGGGWSGGRPDEFLAWDRALAMRGHVVIMPAYRLAPDYQWPAPREDVQAAVAWVRARSVELGIEPEDLTVMGRSAGGQIASASALGDPGLGARRCVVLYAPADMVFGWEHARPDDLLDSLSLLRDYLGGPPEDREEAYRTASAIALIDSASPPILLMHGARDTLVWVRQSRRLKARAQEIGGRATYLEFPWGVHAFDYFPNSPGGQLAISAVVDFIKGDP